MITKKKNCLRYVNNLRMGKGTIKHYYYYYYCYCYCYCYY